MVKKDYTWNQPMLSQTHSPALRHLTTAHLAQTMSLLSLTASELRQNLEAALASNPALELLETRRCPACHRPLPPQGPCPLCSRPENQGNNDEPIVFLSPREDFSLPRNLPETSDELDDNQAVESESLAQFVLKQIALNLDPADRPLAAHILTSLDDDGLLMHTAGTDPLSEIARFHHVPLARVQAVQRLIQHAEPVGVGSSTPQEALLAQIEALTDTGAVPPFTAAAIQHGMDLLSHRKYTELGKILSISTEQARTIASYIGDNLNPYPGRAHWGENHQRSDQNPLAFHTPDAIITRLSADADSPLVVEVLSPFAGALRLNPLFREALQQAPADKVGQWQADLEQAILLVKCLQQRNQAIVRLLQLLVRVQREFILFGETHHRPLTRAWLARELGVHESTISRAVAHKTVQMPNGHIVALARFFDRSLQVRTALKQIIEKHGTAMSDSAIAEELARQGYPVARRTVAKYRAMEGILPSNLRPPIAA